MSSIFSNNSAAELIQGSKSSLDATEQQYTQAFTENAQLDTEQAGLTEEVASLNAENAAIEGRDEMGEQAQAYNNSGVLLQGTPMKVIAQTQSMASQQVGNIIAQGQLSSQSSLIQANQTLNSGYAGLLGMNNQYLTQLAQAKIGSEMNMVSGFGNDIASGINLLTGTQGGAGAQAGSILYNMFNGNSGSGTGASSSAGNP